MPEPLSPFELEESLKDVSKMPEPDGQFVDSLRARFLAEGRVIANNNQKKQIKQNIFLQNPTWAIATLMLAATVIVFTRLTAPNMLESLPGNTQRVGVVDQTSTYPVDPISTGTNSETPTRSAPQTQTLTLIPSAIPSFHMSAPLSHPPIHRTHTPTPYTQPSATSFSVTVTASPILRFSPTSSAATASPRPVTITPTPWNVLSSPTPCIEELIHPTITDVQPSHILPGSEITIMGTGGYIQDSCGGINESARVFELYLDNIYFGSLQCYANHCQSNLLLADTTTSGVHCLSIQKDICEFEFQVMQE